MTCGLGITGIALLIILAAALIISFFIFWLSMLIDCCKRNFNKGIERLIWLLIIIVGNLLGVTIYYFLVVRYHPDGIVDKEGRLK